MQPACEIHFLDVGQGSTSVVRYSNKGRREAIIIDCARGKLILELLKFMSVDYIPALIVTHNDDDHFRGLWSILRDEKWGNEPDRIGKLYLVKDRSTHDSTRNYEKLVVYLKSRRDANNLTFDVDWLKREDAPIHSVMVDKSALEIRTLAPDFLTHVMAENPNDSSGVVELKYAGVRILFCGDAPGATWEAIRRRRKVDPDHYEAVVVPHHGGRIPVMGETGDYSLAFWDAIKAKFAILSFGASNGHGHPREDVILAARQSSTNVLSTQVHPLCNVPPYDGSAGIVQPTVFSQSGRDHALSLAENRADRRRHFACAGSITLSLAPGHEPRWGAGEDSNDRICGFASLEHLKRAIDTTPWCRACSKLCCSIN